MKVFISHAHQDKKFVNKLAEELKANNIDVWFDEFELKPGDNIIQMIENGIKECDYVIAVFSKSYSNSDWAKKELNAFAIKELSNKTNNILPILIEDCKLPIFLSDRLYLDFRNEFDKPFNKIIKFFNRQPSEKRESTPERIIFEQKLSSINYQVSILRDHFRKGELTLFCGAGISENAGVPCWNDLLKYLLSNLFIKKIENMDEAIDGLEDKLAELYQKHFNTSPLMVAQYLKNGLGDDFLDYVRNGLYDFKPKSSELINVITELSRPQRSRESLNSIITFNFDDLIEQNFKSNHIKFRSIFKEGQRCLRSELPIYHVHGFLPRKEKLTPENEIVFSEDAYHSQFIDSFSWSNLIQLNHLNQNVCIFIGLSMTDPNLRRLLDVSMRKNPDREANHFVFKKRYDKKSIDKNIKVLGITDENRENANNFIKIAEFLEEQDSNNLGLNVIWIDDYSEIPKILNQLLEDSTKESIIKGSS